MASLTDSIPPRRAASQMGLWTVRAGAFALALAGTFGAGLFFGAARGEGQEPGQKARSGDALAFADAKTERLEEVRKRLRARFHEELTGPPRDVQTQKVAPAAPFAGKKAAAETSAKMPEALEKTVIDQASPPERVAREREATGADAAEDVEAIAAPREETPKDRRRLAEALARVLGDDASSLGTDDEEPAEAVPAKAAKTRFFLQVAASPNEEGTRALADKLRAQGFAATVMTADLGERGTIFRVRIGPFSERTEAEAKAEAVREKAGLAGFVVAD